MKHFIGSGEKPSQDNLSPHLKLPSKQTDLDLYGHIRKPRHLNVTPREWATILFQIFSPQAFFRHVFHK